MLAQVVRSGVVEATHEGAVAALDVSGRLMASHGDIDRSYFIRSSAKPFQAMAAIRAGARFEPEELAVVCASHGAEPIHEAYVLAMLGADGLDESALQCPPGWPISPSARDRLIRAGHVEPRRRWYNCSGKHAGMLRACLAAGWPIEAYLSVDHPLQELIRATMSEALDAELGAAGVDGCGAPVYSVSTRSLARGYTMLATSSEYQPIRSAMERYGALTAHSNLMAAPSRRWGLAAKGGAEGCWGLAVRGRFGLAIKSFDGGDRPLGPAILDAMEQLGVAPLLTRRGYAGDFRVETLGGGLAVGVVESCVELKT